MLLAGLASDIAQAQETAAILGVVTDMETQGPLGAANVVLTMDGVLVAGTASTSDGSYVLSDVLPGDYDLVVRFIGYGEERVPVSLQAGAALTIDVALQSDPLDLNTVIVSTSRLAEKVLESPASISVLDSKEIRAEATLSATSTLRHVPGVDIARTGINRREIVLRGFNNAFSGASYVLTDYRHAAVASLGVNSYTTMPISPIDLERIEVVRGPGSALFGAGVDAGVIHFVTKDPFNHPGTTLNTTGGTRNMMRFAARHAGVINGKLGYKIVAEHGRAKDWAFDENDAHDKEQLSLFRESALPVDYGSNHTMLGGLLAWRFRPNVTLTLNGGSNTTKGIMLSGIGTLQADGFRYTYGQVRLDAGNFFAQAYLNANHAGNSFVYRDGAVDDVVDRSSLVSAQMQYDFGLLRDRLRFVVGADYDVTTPDTEETVNGRNEQDDQFQEIGAYMQSTVHLHPKLDVTMAIRGDRNNIFEDPQFSPRAALVFKPTPAHSLRATFNRAFAPPSTNALFLDIDAGALGELITLRARGAANGYTFRRDPQYGGLVASSLLPDAFGNPAPVGMPLDLVYELLYAGLRNIPPAQLEQILASQGIQVPAVLIPALLQLLQPGANGIAVSGVSQSRLGYLNLNNGQLDRVRDDVNDLPPLEQSVSQTVEVGYKGVIGNRLLLAVDGYYARKRNFVGSLEMVSPLVLTPDIETLLTDLQGAMATGIAGNETLSATLQALDLSPEQVAGLIANLSRESLEASLPPYIGILQPRENTTPGQIMLTYRNFGNISYYGVDASSRFQASDQLTLFANLSWVSDNFFDADDLDEPETTRELSLNAPKTKIKGGFYYEIPSGWSFNASARHIGEFRVLSGFYDGTVEAYTLLDLGMGYDFSDFVPGLRLQLSVFNVLNNNHRQFIGAPRIGRTGLAQLTIDLP